MNQINNLVRGKIDIPHTTNRPTDAELLARIQFIPQAGQLFLLPSVKVVNFTTGAIQGPCPLLDLINALVAGRTFDDLQHNIKWLTLDDLAAVKLWVRRFVALGDLGAATKRLDLTGDQ